MQTQWNEFQNPFPFVGRANELSQIHDLLLRKGLHVLLVGPAASGKSSVVREYLGQYASNYSSAAMLPLGHVYGEGAIWPLLAEQLGLGVKARSLEGARAELIDYLQKQRSIVVLDALDEANPAYWSPLVHNLADLMNWGMNSRLLITSRTEEADSAIRSFHPSSGRKYAVVRLGALSLRDADRMAEEYFQTKLTPALRDAVALIHSRSDGNPYIMRLFLDELRQRAIGAVDVSSVMETIYLKQWGAQGWNIVIAPTEQGLKAFAALQDSAVGVLTPVTEVVVGAPFVHAQTHSSFWRGELERFDGLLNDPSAREHHFQEFFERNSRFLTGVDYARAVPHPVLAREADGPLIPDFFLQPLDGDFCDILDLKLPTSNLIVGSKDRLRLSSSVAEAVAQLREYGNYFEDPAYRKRVKEKYGLTAYKPQLFVVIGRSPSRITAEQYRRIVSGNGDVRLMTYDDLRRRITQMISLGPFLR